MFFGLLSSSVIVPLHVQRLHEEIDQVVSLLDCDVCNLEATVFLTMSTKKRRLSLFDISIRSVLESPGARKPRSPFTLSSQVESAMVILLACLRRSTLLASSKAEVSIPKPVLAILCRVDLQIRLYLMRVFRRLSIFSLTNFIHNFHNLIQ